MAGEVLSNDALTNANLSKSLTKIGDDLRRARLVHDAVTVAFGDRIDLSVGYTERAERAESLLALRHEALEKSDCQGMAADLVKHICMLRVYLEGARDPKKVSETLQAAQNKYHELNDRYGEMKTDFLKTWINRVNGGTSAPAERGELLEGSGFDFATGLFACEKALALINNPEPDGNSIIMTLQAELKNLEEKKLYREMGYVLSTIAIVQVFLGSLKEAEHSLSKAGQYSVPKYYEKSQTLELQLDIIANRHQSALVAKSLNKYGEAIVFARCAIKELQSIPSGWYRSQQIDDPFFEPFQAIYTAAIEICGSVEQNSALECLEIIEMARRSSLAGLVRNALTKSQVESSLPHKRLQALHDALLEESSSGLSIHNSKNRDEILAPLLEGPGAWLAEVCFLGSETVLLSEMVKGVRERKADILVVFSEPESFSGVCIYWEAETADPLLHQFELAECDQDFIVSLRESKPAEEDNDPARWKRIGDALIPPTLAKKLRESKPSKDGYLELLISPTGPLSCLPWAALGIGSEEEVLVDFANLGIIPALTMLRKGKNCVKTKKFRFGVESSIHDDKSAEQIAQSWNKAGITVIGTRLEAIKLLQCSKNDNAGAVIVAHGGGTGLDQGLNFQNDEDRLTAIDILGVSTPTVMVLVSCFTGQVQVQAGLEPFALSLACLASGTEEFIAGVLEVPLDFPMIADFQVVGALDPFHGIFSENLCRGDAATASLGAAQRSAREQLGQLSNTYLPARHWAGLQAIVAR